MFTMSPAEAKATIGVNRLPILRLKEEATSRLRPMDISPGDAQWSTKRGQTTFGYLNMKPSMKWLKKLQEPEHEDDRSYEARVVLQDLVLRCVSHGSLLIVFLSFLTYWSTTKQKIYVLIAASAISTTVFT